MLNEEKLTTDFCVIGGGMAGLCAALAAARCGLNTVLMHDRPVLGGNASSECRIHITGACQHGSRPDARETGILEELQLQNLAVNPQRSYSLWDTVLWRAAAEQARLRLLLNCSCYDARQDGERVTEVTGWQLTTQKRIRVEAAQFADCTGDAVTAALAGAEFRHGREGREEFGESLAPEEPDDHTMGMSCLFGARQTERPIAFTPPTWAYRFERPEDLPHRAVWHPAFGYWWVELGGDRDTIADTEQVRDELLRIVYGVWDYVKNRSEHETENLALDWVQFLPAKRESRRLVGDHLLCQGDIESGGRFEDVVAYGGWAMDRHPPAGIWDPGPPAQFGEVPDLYGIPLRSLYSRNVANLWMAGRDASCTHIGMSSTRVMGTCSLMGQAVGTAAAYALRRGLSPRECAAGGALDSIQQKLLACDCYLPGFSRRFGPATQQAALSASVGNPEPLRDGTNRQVHDEDHSWHSSSGDWVEYRWKQPRRVRSITLAFDSNLSRPVALSHFRPEQSPTAPPPELVKAFRIEAEVEGRWSTVHEERSNHQRFRTLAFDDLSASALRLAIGSTHGSDEARLFTFAVNEPAAEEFD